VKVIFDNNLSPKMARAFGELFKEEHQVFALKDKFAPKTTDLEWITELSNDDRWVVISGDRRITRNKTEYHAFRSSRLIGFFMSKGLYKSRVIKQTERILAQWESIERQYQSVHGGAVFELQMRGTYLRQLKE
jgi:PIN like domain